MRLFDFFATSKSQQKQKAVGSNPAALFVSYSKIYHFSPNLKNLTSILLFLSPFREKALNSPHLLQGLGLGVRFGVNGGNPDLRGRHRGLRWLGGRHQTRLGLRGRHKGLDWLE